MVTLGSTYTHMDTWFVQHIWLLNPRDDIAQVGRSDEGFVPTLAKGFRAIHFGTRDY